MADNNLQQALLEQAKRELARRQTATPPTSSIGDYAGSQYTEAGQKIISSPQVGAESIGQGEIEFQQGVQQRNLPKAALGIGRGVFGTAQAGIGAAAGMVQGIAAPFTAMAQKGAEFIPSSLKPTIWNPEHPIVKTFNELTQKYPQQATLLSDALQVILAGWGSEGLDIPLKNPMGVAKNLVQDVAKVPGKIADVAGGIKAKITKPFQVKKEAEIFATPESQLSKLSTEEQKLYIRNKTQQTDDFFKSKRDAILQEEKAANQQAETSGVARDMKVKQENEILLKNLEQEQKAAAAEIKKNSEAAIKQSQERAKQVAKDFKEKGEKLQTEAFKSPLVKREEILPKIQQGFREQGMEYRRLTESKIIEHGDMQVDAANIREKINAEYGGDPKYPNDAHSIINIMQVPEHGITTIGKLYEQTLKLGQEIGKAAKAGTRAYTSYEVSVQKAIHVLTETMAENGVDMSEARAFWKNWAPIRDRIISVVKPYDIHGIAPQTFTGKLTAVVEGTTKMGVENANFIKEIEKLIGEPITEETKIALSKLKLNEAQAIAAKIQFEAEQEMIQSASETAQAEVKSSMEARKTGIQSATEAKQTSAKISTEAKQTDITSQYGEKKTALSIEKMGAERDIQSLQSSVARKAEIRTRVKRIIYSVLGLGATGEVIKHSLPFLP